jgi:ABC-type polysaccharide/polyol phosphate export permease
LGLQDIRVRFQRSLLGPVWILLNMLLFVIGAGVLYGFMIRQPMRVFLPYVCAGFSLWGFIVSSLTESAQSFIIAEGYIKQFCFPKQIYLLRMLVTSSIVLVICMSVVLIVQVVAGTFSPSGWLAVPPGLILLLLAGLGHTVVCAYLGVRFRDLPHAMGGLLQVGFFVTPVMYPVEILNERGLDFVYRLNPLHYLIDVVRFPIMKGSPAPIESYAFCLLYIVVVWGLAFLVTRGLDTKVSVLL